MDNSALKASLVHRLRYSNGEIEEALQEHHQEASLLASLASFGERFSHVVYLRLTWHEKAQLERDIFQWGYRSGWPGEREAAEELSRHPTDEFLEQVAFVVFRKWSWADAVLRHLLGTLLFGAAGLGGGGGDGGGSGGGDALVEEFAAALGTRHDEVLPGDSRRKRVEQLLADDVNSDFFDAFRTNPGELLGSTGPRAAFGVAPHPDDLPVWRLLAYQVQKNERLYRKLRGIAEAAGFAMGWREEHGSQGDDDASMEGNTSDDASNGSTVGGDSFEDDSITRSDEVDGGQARTKIPLTSYASTDSVVSSLSSSSGDSEASSSTTSFEAYRQRSVYGLLEASDVWDVWILCQVLRCEEAVWGVDQCEGTERVFYNLEKLQIFQDTWVHHTFEPNPEQEFFRRRAPLFSPVATAREGTSTRRANDISQDDGLVQDYLLIKSLFSLPLPREFVEFAKYVNYDLCNIEDEEVIASLLTSAGLLDDTDSRHNHAESSAAAAAAAGRNAKDSWDSIEWDLVYLNPSRRDPLREESDREHLHHTLHVPDDYIQFGYDGNGGGGADDLPGLCHPCECRELSQEEVDREHEEEEDEEEGEDRAEAAGKKAPEQQPLKVPPSPGYLGRLRREKLAELKREMRRQGRWRTYPQEHYEYNHAGGNVVFNRHRLEDVPEFVTNLDRFFVDWNDCMLIMGAGQDDDTLEVIDENTIYILETLPGIKARRAKLGQGRLGLLVGWAQP